MSRSGNCYVNAVMESFFHSPKVECVYQTRYWTRAEARRDIFEYIEGLYNSWRLHSSCRSGILAPYSSKPGSRKWRESVPVRRGKDHKRKLVEQTFGWMKTVGGMRKTRHNGVPRVEWMFTLAAAYNLVRLQSLTWETG